MRRFVLALSFFFLAIASKAHAVTHITATSLATSQTWGPSGGPADNAYSIEPPSGSTFTIPAGITLTIQPGTVVRLKGGISLIVNGTLSASGTAPDPMVFDSLSTQWGGINVATTGTISLSGCTIQNFGTWPVYGTVPQVASLFGANAFVPRADGKFNAIRIRGSTISESVTLTRPDPGFCYISDGFPLLVSGAGGPVLTIADLTMIKFGGANSYLQIGGSNSGGLKAKGVVFTSSLDDTLGDTDGGGASVGAPGQWPILQFLAGTLSPQTVLDSCEVRYGGGVNHIGVQVQSSEPTLTRCVIENMEGVGLRVELTATGSGITGNLLRNSTKWELSAPPVAMANLMPNNRVELSGDGKYNGYQLQGATISADLTLPRPPAGFCYITEGVNPLVVSGAGGPVLTIADLTMIKFGGFDSDLLIPASPGGGLKAKGVAFTSWQDDTLGDTDGGGPSVGAPGQWQGLVLEEGTLSAQTVLDGCEVRYGGANPAFVPRQGVLVRGSQPTITHCVMRNSQGFNLRLEQSATGEEITGNLLRNSTTWELSAPLAAMANLMPNNTVELSGDGKYNGYHIQGGTTAGSIVLPKPPVPMAYYFSGPVTVPTGASLTIPEGCVCKMAGVGLLVQGTLSVAGIVREAPFAPVVFTSYRDDTWWGDTNGDGPSSGAGGDWQRVEITGANNPSVVNGAIFLYGGSGALGQLYVNGTGTQANPNVLIKNCHFALSGAITGVRTLTSNTRVDSCSFFGGTAMLGVSNATTTVTVVASNSWWGSPSGPFDPSAADPCTNPSGTGAGVSDFVNYCPFRTSEVPVTGTPEPPVATGRAGIVWVGPNPARSEVAVMLESPEDDSGVLEFLDLAGRVIRRFALTSRTTGPVRWDLTDATGRRVEPGVYLARYRHGQMAQVRRVVLTK